MSRPQTPQPKALRAMTQAEVSQAFVALTQAAAAKGIPSIGGLTSSLGSEAPKYELTVTNTSAPQERVEGREEVGQLD